MSGKLAIAAFALSACAAQSPNLVTSTVGQTAGGLPDEQCSGLPVAPSSDDDDHLRHTSSHLVMDSGDPRHRGDDLIAPASADPQTLTGVIAYSHFDKALEDEDVELFACMNGGWKKLGTARTSEEGGFALALSGDARLPVGMRDLYVSVVGDRSGAQFIAFVAPDGSKLVVSDVDGTLTSSENEFLETVAGGSEAETQAGAPDALGRAAARGYQLVYVTARGNYYAGDTRKWLVDKGFPRGPMRLANSRVTLPGSDTVAYKESVLGELASGFQLAAGLGNRDSDITAYTNAGVPADRILIKLPEFADECRADLDANKAIGFTDYNSLAGITLR